MQAAGMGLEAAGIRLEAAGMGLERSRHGIGSRWDAMPTVHDVPCPQGELSYLAGHLSFLTLLTIGLPSSLMFLMMSSLCSRSRLHSRAAMVRWAGTVMLSV